MMSTVSTTRPISVARDHDDDDDDDHDDDDEAAVHPDVHTSGIADKHSQQAHLRDHDFGGASHASSTSSPRAEGQTRSDRWRELPSP
jgi:hypothetical protein